MEYTAVDALRLVALSGVVLPAEVELVCLTACNACRESSGDYSITIKPGNARILSRKEHGASDGATSTSADAGTPSTTTRIMPHRRVLRLLLQSNLRLADVAWPEGLHTLRFGWAFDHPIEGQLPRSLIEIDLGGTFNHHVEEVAWPPGLEKLRFGDRFNRPVELMAWPAMLRSLSFGSSFDQPIESVEWPPALESLTLGEAFNHPVQRAAWSETRLRKLDLGMAFRQSVAGVAWPSGLKELRFGACFDQELEPRELPRGLEVLVVSDSYMLDNDELTLMDGFPPSCTLHIESVVLSEHDRIDFY